MNRMKSFKYLDFLSQNHFVLIQIFFSHKIFDDFPVSNVRVRCHLKMDVTAEQRVKVSLLDRE